MKLQTASRQKAKIKMALQGPSGSGKTKSALLIGYGLAGIWNKVAVIDTENRSADLYADLGDYKVLSLTAPYTPERYIEAMRICQQNGIQVIIIDSLSHEWEGPGGILDYHGSLPGNSFTNWSKVTPRHNQFIQFMLQCDVHVIATIRVKQEYVLAEKNGKQVPEKVGLKGITRDGTDYEFTLVFDLDTTLRAKASKDRTQLFFGKPDFVPDSETGAMILKWCNQVSNNYSLASATDVREAIAESATVDELLSLFHTYPMYQDELAAEFTMRKQQILSTSKIELTNESDS